MPISVGEMLLIKKKQYQELRENAVQQCGTRVFFSNPGVYPKLQLLLMEIEFLEKRPDASPEDIEFMSIDLEN